MATLPMVGDELAGYRLRGVLGRGGMSVVYEAENPRLGSTVALKVLAPELATNDLFRARFLKESRIAASLNHPNVIPIYDMGAHEDLLFIAMRYVVGADLRAVLRANRVLTPDQTLLLIGQAGRALDAAHRHGLVHRDVKPGNILIERGSDDDSEPDHVYLSDFGISKHVASRSGLTATGEFMGTIDYISPEQIRGRSVDGRADLYSLGCVLYECLTGRVPFDKDVNAAVIWAHVEETPTAPSSLQPTLPPGIDQIMAKALAKDPDDRYATCRELIADARAALLGTGANTSNVPHSATVLASRPVAAEPASPSLGGPASPSFSEPAAPVSFDRAATSGPGASYGQETTPGSIPGFPSGPEQPSSAGGAPSVASAAGLSPAGPPPAGPAPAGLSPAGLSPAGPPPAGPPATGRPRLRTILAFVTGLVVVAAAGGGWLLGHNGNNGTNSPSPSPSTSSSPAPTQQASAPAPPAPGDWAAGRLSPFRVQQLQAAELDNRIWLAGGLLGPDTATNKTEYYDPTVRTWGNGPALPFQVHHAMLVNYDGKLMLIGGFLPVGHNLEASASDKVLILDPAKNQWVEGPPLHHARAAGTAVVIGDQVVVTGGRTGGKVETEVKQTEIYNGKTWRDAPDIPVPGDHLGGVTDGTYLYTIGGRNLSVSENHTAVQRFNPKTGQWTQLTPLPVADSDMGAAYIDGQLITFGGENLFSVFKTGRSYNLATKKWSTLQDLPAPRHGMGVIVLGQTIYAIDGASEPGHDGSTSTMYKLRFKK
jgi:non-specific serine/threonine protein kinase